MGKKIIKRMLYRQLFHKRIKLFVEVGTVLSYEKLEFFYENIKGALKAVEKKQNPIMFLKSWNEWGERNMIVADIIYGSDFIDILRKILEERR